MIDPGRWTRPRWILAAAGIPFLLGLLLTWLPPGPLADWEANARDLVWRTLPPRPVPEDGSLLVVDIDQRAVNAWGSHSEWLQTRRLPELLDWLARADARTVVLDILLDPKSPEADHRLVEAVQANGRVITGFQFAAADPSSFLPPMDSPPAPLDTLPGLAVSGSPLVWQPERMECGLPAVIAASAGYGFVNNDPDRGGVFRSSLPLAGFAGRYYPSLALAGVLHQLGWSDPVVHWNGPHALELRSPEGGRTIPLDHARMEVRFRAGVNAFQRVSIFDVLSGKLDPGYARDRLVLVGSSLPGLDLKPVPLHDSYPGVEIQATVASNLLAGDPLVSLGRGASLLLLALVALASSLLFALKRLWIGLPGLALLVALVWAGAWITLDRGLPVPPLVLPAAVCVLAGLLMGLWRLQGEMRDRHFISNAFSLYVSREVLGELLDHPERLRLGGERSSLSLLFADIRSFTRLSEGLQPADLGGLLNRYLTAMSRVILDHGGTVDKYIGDEVVAIFGAPLPLPDHETRACRTAVSMQRRLAELRAELAGTPFDALQIGVGVHTGLVMVGNFGSEMRFSYTAIGDAMNLASRLEGLTKEYGVGILVSSTTLERAGTGFHSRRLDRVRVLGKSEPVEIHALYDSAPDPECVSAYEQAWLAYAAGRFSEAAGAFAACVARWPDDGPSRTLAARCRILAGGSRPHWDGVWQMDRK